MPHGKISSLFIKGWEEGMWGLAHCQGTGLDRSPMPSQGNPQSTTDFLVTWCITHPTSGGGVGRGGGGCAKWKVLGLRQEC